MYETSIGMSDHCGKLLNSLRGWQPGHAWRISVKVYSQRLQVRQLIWTETQQCSASKSGSTRPTLWIAPAVLSMKAACQSSFTDTAVKPAKVIPAANGCWEKPTYQKLESHFPIRHTPGTLNWSSYRMWMFLTVTWRLLIIFAVKEAHRPCVCGEFSGNYQL